MEREQIDLNISELETRLDRLRALYEHYFMGIERIEPSVARKDVERRVADLRKARFHSTAQRFKFQTIVQRYNTMQQHWSRICREIELGTFRRHKLKAERTFDSRPPPRPAAAAPAASDRASQDAAPSRTPDEAQPSGAPAAQPAARPPADSFADGEFPAIEFGTAAGVAPDQTVPAGAPEAGAGRGVLGRLRETGSSTLTRGLLANVPPDLAGRISARAPAAPMPLPMPPAAGARAEKPAGAAAPPAASPPAASPPPGAKTAAKADGPVTASGTLSEARVRALHQAYVDARKQTNAKAVSFEKLERSLRETETKLRGSHQGRSVDFEVVIKDGKAILKPKLT